MRLAPKTIVCAAIAAGMFVGGLLLTAPPTWGQGRALVARDPAEDDRLGNLALAERVAQSAQLLLQTSSMAPPVLRQSAVMLEIANKLAPTEPRFLRLLTEAYLQIGGDEGREGAISSLKRYLSLNPNPPDYGAQAQLIDLSYSQLETADERMKRIDYLLQLPPAQLSSQVRCHVALMGAQLAIDRAATSDARKYVNLALRLMPLSPEALKLSYNLMDDDTPPAQRVALLVQMLISNPAQPSVMRDLASECTDAGMVDSGLQWYQNLFLLYQRMGNAPMAEDIDAYAAELVIGDQLSASQGLVEGMLNRDPNDINAAFLNLIVTQRGKNQDAITTAADKAKSALLNRLGAISDELNQRPTTAPAAAPGSPPLPPAAPDIPADVKKLATMLDSDMATAYASTLGDLAWLEIYFNRKSADAQQYLTALRDLLPADSVVLTRLDGWSFLVDDKKGEAKVKLSAVADRDPFAQLGMILLDDQVPAAQQSSAAKKLLLENPDGLVGAILIESLRSKVGLMPTSPDVDAIRSELAKFPREWLDILDPTKTNKFYALKASTSKVSHAFAEPMLATISITNTSAYDLTIGPGGTIHPDLWIDVQIKGLALDMIPGVAIERITQSQLLHPKESLTLTMRVDQGKLVQKLSASPQLSMPLYFYVLTNPMTQPSGVTPGPAGYRQIFSPVAERAPTPLNGQALQNLYTQLQNGAANVRMQTLDLLAAFARVLSEQNDEKLKTQGKQVIDVIRNSTGDRSQAVRAEATLVTAMLSDPKVREGIIQQMLNDASFSQRVMGLVAVQLNMDPAQRKEALKPIAGGDQDPLIKQMAAAMVDVASLPPTTAPTTEPTTAPAGAGI